MLDTIKVIYQSLRDGHIKGARIDNRPVKWVGFILWIPLALALYAVGMGIFWVVYGLLILPLMFLGLYWFTRKAVTFGDEGIKFTKAYGRCLIPWTEIHEVVYRREPAGECYRLKRTLPGPQPKAYTIASTPDNPLFERTLREKQIPFRRLNWMDEPVDANGTPLEPGPGA